MLSAVVGLASAISRQPIFTFREIQKIRRSADLHKYVPGTEVARTIAFHNYLNCLMLY